MPSTMLDLIALRRLDHDRFESMHHPQKMGNSANIAYGGCTLGVAASAAHADVPMQYRLYSMTGHFLGPALTDRNLLCSVRDLRRTRTFITKLVEVSQTLDSDTQRTCLVTSIDFHKVEPESLLEYCKPPTRKYQTPATLATVPQLRRSMVDRGVLSEEVSKFHEASFSLLLGLFDFRYSPEGVSGQNLHGWVRKTQTTQDHLPIEKRRAADWFKCKEKLQDPSQHASTLAFVLDAAISFLPLTLQSLSLADAGACSTLDFALRILDNDLDLNAWHLREMKTIAGGNGRTYSESQLWNSEGKMIASMTQTSILRPEPTGEPKL